MRHRLKDKVVVVAGAGEIGNALASRCVTEGGRDINGQAIGADGGMTMRPCATSGEGWMESDDSRRRHRIKQVPDHVPPELVRLFGMITPTALPLSW